MSRSPFSVQSPATALLALSLAVSLPCCGGGSSSTPTGPTAAATPAPSPSATATPPPSSANPSLSRSCQGLPAYTGSPSGCARGASNFQSRVRGAVDLAIGSTYRDPQSGETIDIVQGAKIKAVGAYLKTVSDDLDRQGVCAVFDGEEIWVSDGGGYNENFDIITAEGNTWVNYTVTCNPTLPMPPVQPSPPARDTSCSLPASRSVFCVRDEPGYDGDVYAAQDALIEADRARATPQVFDFNERFSSQAPYGYKIINEDLYVSEMLKQLKARGFCAIHDGDEFQVKRRTNTYSENYDLTKQDGYAIRLYGATCRDAGF